MHFSQDHLLIIQKEKKYHTGYWALESSILQINGTICRFFAVLIWQTKCGKEGYIIWYISTQYNIMKQIRWA